MKKMGLFVFFGFLCTNLNIASADTFGTGANQFNIDFVTISGDSGNLGNWWAGFNYRFSGVNHGDYRMGKFEITNDQWNKFQAAYGPVTGTPADAYKKSAYWPGTNVPANNISWNEAAQFVNFLNTSQGYQPAYNFTGTKGTSNYTFAQWSVNDTGYNASNPFRNRNAFYFLPTENEFLKAAYWNGTSLQMYATRPGDTFYQGHGSNGGWNYYTNVYATDPFGLWSVGSGSQELNGTYDMMGNVTEWMENTWFNDFWPIAEHCLRGGAYNNNIDNGNLGSYRRSDRRFSYDEDPSVGFRVASIPEPCSLVLLFLGGLMLRRKK